MLKPLVFVLLGAAAATAFILSCSDDAPADVDAAEVCDCPEAEPPLVGRIVRVTNDTQVIDANAVGTAPVVCPTGGTLLGGSCDLAESNAEITLNRAAAGSDPDSFTCKWNNPTNEANTMIATAICLVPAE